MAKVVQEFELHADPSSLFRAQDALEKTANATDRANSSFNRFVSWNKKAAGAAAQAVKSTVAQQIAYNRVDEATRSLVGELEQYQAAIQDAFTDSQRDKAIDQLLKKMEKVGLVFTSDAAEIERADLVARSSLESLAQSGDIAANSLAKIQFNEQKTTSRMERTQKALQKLGNGAKWVASHAKSAVSAFLGFGKAASPVDKLSNRLTRTVVALFSVRRVLRYITEAMERAPDNIGNSFKTLGTGIKDEFARVMVSAMGGMQRGVDRLNQAFQSKAGQTFLRGLERAAQLAGNVVGKLLEKGAQLVEFLGNHAQEAFTVAAVAAAFFAAQMLVSAAASAAAAWPILLIVGLAAALVIGLEKAGYTSEQIFEKIGQGAGLLYAFCHNLVVDAYNLFATFAEFFANVFNDPVAAVAHLFFDTFDVILSMVETAAKAIDLLTGSKLAAGVSGFRSNLQSWVDKTFGKNEITIARMEKISYLDTAGAWGKKAAEIGSSFSLDSLGSLMAPEIKAIQSDTSAIKKAVSLSKEDLKSLVDIAERRFVNQVNLTSLQPVITVNGANTGSTEKDRLSLANAIKEVLIDQISSGSTVSTVIP